MIPHERSLVEKLKGRPFAIVGVNSDKVETLQKLVKEGTVIWRSFVNEQAYGAISKAWGVSGWPTLFLIDHKGVIRHKGLRGEEMEKAILSLLVEAEKEASSSPQEKSIQKEPQPTKPVKITKKPVQKD